MDQIDKSYRRLSNLPSVRDETAVEFSPASDILLDPVGNCPLKIYTSTRGDISLLTTVGYIPPLRLGTKQQEVQEMSGTVLLLGRSGTGKTVCLSDRMTKDREFMRVTSGVVASQLFVSRSRRLCEFVKGYQTLHTADKSDLKSVDFMMLESFMVHMESVVNKVRSLQSASWSLHKRQDFEQFATRMVDAIQHSGLDATVVWMQIRSFVKGSIEAVVQKAPLALEQYLDESAFGLERCRLQSEQRKQAYKVYLLYNDLLRKNDMWDDADRVLNLLNRSKLKPFCACNGKGADYHKVYVDEVQDNTQAEIVLYFLAAGMNTQSLFLAGDPAQSVVEGVDFRFEDVRAIVFRLSGGADNIARPIKLFVNYRSHAGILNCAAAILDKMFAMFPGSAKVLPRDAGLFKGPRPACCTAFGIDALLAALRLDERLVVICPDNQVEETEKQLIDAGVNNLVLGIRAAKGLEFQDIVLYDFFSSIPVADHKAWKSLLSDEYLEPYSYPQIELQMKLLYTAITRSCNRLIYIESQNISLCSVFFRWLKAKDLAEPFSPAADGEVILMTSDEWRVRGIDFALSAEGSESVLFFQRAVRSFELAGDASLANRVEIQISLELLRKQLTNGFSSEQMSARDENHAAGLVLEGLKTGLLEDVRRLCSALKDSVKERVYFEEYVLNILNTL